MKKPISRKAHGIIDYAFAAAQIAGPLLLGLNRGAKTKEIGVASGVALHGMLSNTPVGLKKLVPFKMHRNIDIATLGTMALASLLPDYRKDKRAMIFHWSLIAMGVATVLLTDWED